jgi:hypothetical protein
MLLEKLIAFFPHLLARTFVKKEASQLRKELFFSGYLNRSSCLNQTAGDFQEIKHIRAEENALSEEQRLERVMTAYPDKTPTHKD